MIASSCPGKILITNGGLLFTFRWAGGERFQQRSRLVHLLRQQWLQYSCVVQPLGSHLAAIGPRALDADPGGHRLPDGTWFRMAPSLQGGCCLIVQNDQSVVTDAAVCPAVFAIIDCSVQFPFMGLQGPVLRVFSTSHYHDLASHEPTTTALCEKIARTANHEDCSNGRFWADRFKAAGSDGAATSRVL